MDPHGRLGVKVNAGLARRLEEAAAERGLTAGWLANRLIAEGLDNLLPADEFSLTRPPRGDG